MRVVAAAVVVDIGGGRGVASVGHFLRSVLMKKEKLLTTNSNEGPSDSEPSS